MKVTDQRAIVLLSGGLDSATTLAIAIADGFEAYAISFNYGQRHSFELEAANRVAKALAAKRHVVLDINFRQLGGSALTDEIEVPKGRSLDDMVSGVPVTYVPARNTVFLSCALAWAETIAAADIYIGVNALDYSGYPDCRSQFIEAFEKMANVATKASAEGNVRYRIRTPLINLTKAQIISRGLELGIDYATTSSCYDPGARGKPCGACDSCLLRAKGFAEAGLKDPLMSRFEDS